MTSHVQLGGYIADYACQVNSIIGPYLGPNLSVEAFVHIINSTGMKLVFCAKTLTSRFIEVAAQCPSLKYIVQLEDLSDYQKRPKVEAAKQGLRESAKKNFLRNSLKSASTTIDSTKKPAIVQPTASTSQSSEPIHTQEAIKPSDKLSSQPADELASTSPAEPTKAETHKDFRNDVNFGALLERDDIEEWKKTLFESGGPILLCLSDLERLGEMVEDVEEVITGEDELETLVYTSGSTGIPKGAMFTAKAWRSQLCHKWASSGIDVSVTWSISDRKNDFRHLYYGGAVAIYNGNMARIFDDIAEVKPDQLNATPAFWNKIYAEFKAELAEATKHMVIDADLVYQSSYTGASLSDIPPILNANSYADPVEFRRIRDELCQQFVELVGGRVEKIVTGGAPTSPEVIAFLRMCFKCSVRESYGSTECGGIVSAGLFVQSIEWKLVSWEEYTVDDQPFPRGELCVRRKDMMSGYYGEKDLTQEALDDDGYYHTGDIVELNSARDGAVIIDRKKNIFKLAQGEYVAPAKVEKLLIGNSPFIKQVFVYGDSFKSSLVAVIVPHKQVLAEHLGRADKKDLTSPAPTTLPDLKKLSLEDICKREDAILLLLEECGRIGRQFNLRSFEIPAALILTATEFTKENGLQTQSDKPARHSLLKFFSQDIEKLYKTLDSQFGETKDAVYQLFGKTLSNEVDFSAMAPDDEDGAEKGENLTKKLTFVQMGGDSLTAVKLRNMIKKEFDVALPVDILMNPDTDMDRIAAFIDDSKRNKKTVSNGTSASNHVAVDLRTLMTDSKMDPDWRPAGQDPDPEKKRSLPSDLPFSKWEHVFLTGSTGFLGTAILAEILKSTTATVYCLVRPKRAKAPRPVDPSKASSSAPNAKSDAKSPSKGKATKSDSSLSDELKTASISPATQSATPSPEDFLKPFEDRLLQSGLLGDTIDAMTKALKKTLRQRVVFLVGKLDAEDGYRFGIDDKTFDELCKNVQVVIHAGAEVNTVLPYHRLAKSNVNGTKACLNICSHGRRKQMIHISTTGVTQALQSRAEVPIVEELLALYPRLGGLGGYNLSKLMAELVVWEAIDRGYDATIVRPGFIGSAAGFTPEQAKPSKSKNAPTEAVKSPPTPGSTPFAGFSNQNDYDNRLIVGLTMMGIVPEDISSLVTFPVDFMAKCIVTMASKAERTNGFIYHCTNNSSELTSDLIVQGLRSFGYDIKSVPWTEWQTAAKEMTDETNPIYPMVDEYFSHRFHARHAYVDTTQTQRFIADHLGSKLPRTDLPFVLNWIHWLIKSGILTPPPGYSASAAASSTSSAPSSSAASSLLGNTSSLAIGSAIASTSQMLASRDSELKKDKKKKK